MYKISPLGVSRSQIAVNWNQFSYLSQFKCVILSMVAFAGQTTLATPVVSLDCQSAVYLSRVSTSVFSGGACETLWEKTMKHTSVQ